MLGHGRFVSRAFGLAIEKPGHGKPAQTSYVGRNRGLWVTASAAALIAGLAAGPQSARADCAVDTIGAPSPDTVICTNADTNGVSATSFDDVGLDVTLQPGASVTDSGTNMDFNLVGNFGSPGSNFNFNMNDPFNVISGNGTQVNVNIVQGGGVQNWNIAGSITSSAGDGIVQTTLLGGTVDMMIASTGVVRAAGDAIQLINIAGTYNATLTNNGQIYAGGDAVTMTTGLGGGTMTLNNNNIIGSQALPVGGMGVNMFGVGNAAVNNAATGSIVSVGNAIQIGGSFLGLPLGGTANVVNDGTVTSTDGSGMSIFTLGAIDVTNNGAVTADENGILAIHGDLAGPADINLTSNTGGTIDFSGFVGMGAINLDGNANVTVGDKITYSGGPGFSIGALAVGVDGDATVTVNAAIDPPLIGAASFTFGAGTATTDVNNLVEATGVGAFAGNLGSGNVVVSVDSPNGAIQSDGFGVMTVNIGDGDSTVTLDGPVSGDTTANLRTALDGVSMFGLGNDGNMSVTSTANGTIASDQEAVDIVKLGGSGNIEVDLNANATGGDQGVEIFRTLSGPNVLGGNDITVGIGQTSPMTLTAETDDGIEIITPFAHNDVNVNVGAGSSVIANNGSAINIAGFSLLGDNAVNIENAGHLQGDGTLFDPTIFVATDGAVNIHNDTSGNIQSDGGNAFASIIQSFSGDTNTVTNDGTMTGSVQLFSFNGNSVTNTSSNTWNTAGLNLLLSGGPNVLTNTANGTINTGPLTAFALVGPAENTINNSGVININPDGDSVFGVSLTTFLGTGFVFPPSQNAEFNNSGGLLNMTNGVSDFGLVTPATVPGFLGGPLGPYQNGIGDVTFIAGNFNGTGDSRLGIDAFLDASDTSSSDLLVVGFPGSNVGNTTGSTGIVVNDLNNGPGSYNPDGILVVDVEGDSPKGSFYLVGGPIDKGLFNYDLYRTEVGSVDWILASTPNARAFELPQLITGGQEVWHQSSGVWLDRTADLRTMYGATAVYGPAGGASGASLLGKPAPAPAPDKGMAMAPAEPRYSSWARGFGADYDRDVTNTTTLFGTTNQVVGDYSQDVWGGQAGIDVVVSKNANSTFLIGALGGFATSDMKFDTTGDKATLDGPMAGLYATYLSGAWFVDVLGMGQWLDTDLKTTFDGASASTDINSWGVVADTGYRFGKAGGMFFEPMGTLAWVSTDMDSFDLLGASVDDADGDSLLGRVGLRIGTQFMSGGHRVEPFVVGSLWHEFEGDNSVQLTSAGFVLPIADEIDDTYGEVGGGINIFSLSGNFSAFAKGDVRIADDIDGVSGKAGVRWTW